MSRRTTRLLLIATFGLVAVAATPAGVAVSFPPFVDPGPNYSEVVPAWSPDGGRLAFASNRGDGYWRVYVNEVDADPGAATSLTAQHLVSPIELQWAPNGSSIAVLQAGIWGNHTVGIVRPEGGPTSWIGRGGHYSAVGDIDWARSGDRLVFTRADNDGCVPSCWQQGEVFTIHPDGSEQTNLTNSPESERFASWSPDGKHVVFTRCPAPCWGYQATWSLWSMNADGSGQRQLSADLGDRRAVAWSPTGDLIAFIRDGAAYLIDPDGSGERRLGAASDLDWSPTGKELVTTDGQSVTVHHVDGRPSRRIAEGPSATNPDWSPDGSRIAFQVTHLIPLEDRPTAHRPVSRIMLVDPDGSNLRTFSAPLPEDAAWKEERREAADDAEPASTDKQPVEPSRVARARVTLRHLGGTRFLVRVKPEAPFARGSVVVQRRANEAWRGVKLVRLGADSQRRFSLRVRRPVRLRASVIGDGRVYVSRAVVVRR
jgi:dipeptidyl aminopeptidase/acylaminoacyl peptidase